MNVSDTLFSSSQHRKFFAKDRVITREGENGDRVWLVESGNLSIDVHNAVVATVGEGALVGEMALIDGGPRSATVRALTDVSCLEVSCRKFYRMLDACEPLAANLLESLSDTIRRAQGLQQVRLRDSGTYVSSRERSTGGLPLKSFSSGERIYEEGDVADCAYLVHSGLVTIRREFYEVVRHGPGRIIGELALLDNSPRAATAMAAEQTVCEIISRRQFNSALTSMPRLLRDLALTYTRRIASLQANSG
ncbi:MAG: cyclic nucleotide-binding domain-containing protein [Rhodospirillaceae bacterium]